MRRALLLLSFFALTPMPGAAAQQIAVRRLTAREVPAATRYRGVLEAARRWTDRNGSNLLVLSRTEELSSGGEGGTPVRSREIHAYHYLGEGAALRLLWEAQDFVRDCDVDVILQFAPGSLHIADVDADGVAESSFVYRLACAGGVDPSTLKLIVHEGATKYAIRGSTDLRDLAPSYPAPEMRVDPALARVPLLRAMAIREWRRFVRERQWPDEGAP